MYMIQNLIYYIKYQIFLYKLSDFESDRSIKSNQIFFKSE